MNSKNVDAVEAIQELTGGFGADLVVDAVGIAPTFAQAFRARDLAGRVVLVGVPDPGTTWEIPLDEVFGRGGSIKSAWYGDTLPSRDFPMLVEQYRLGRLDLDGFVSERIGLGGCRGGLHQDEGRQGPAFGRRDQRGAGVSVRIDKIVTSGTFSLDGGVPGRSTTTST